MKRASRIKLALHRGASRAFVLGTLVFLLVAGCQSLFESTNHPASNPPTLSLDIRALTVDGGTLDGEAVDTEALDVEAVDTEAVDAEAVDAEAVDAEAVDAEAVDGESDAVQGQDVLAPLDEGQVEDVQTGSPDVPGVQPNPDAVLIDAEFDAQGAEVRVVLDVGLGVDVEIFDTSPTDILPDVQPVGAEPSPDTATVPPEPNRDTAAPVNEDTAPPAKADAAPPVGTLKGGGFCAIGPAHSASPAGFLALALAGLALLRRRRR
jgi:MYXO-CTERM domain-containing protein